MSIDATNTYNAITVSIPEDNVTVKVSAGLRGPVGFEYIGEYSAGVTYYHTNVVKYNNALYIGLPAIEGTGITGIDPSNSTYWGLMLTSTGPFAAIASQAEAEAGVDNTKGMTPLRTEQALVDHLANDVPTIGPCTFTLGSDATGDIWYRNSGGNFTRLAIGTAGERLSGGTIPNWVGASVMPIVAKAADYTATSSDHTVIVTCSSVNVTITLPAVGSLSDGYIYNIKKVDATAYTVIIDGNASETIDGATTFTLTSQYENLTIQSDGSNWHIL